ncbi:lipid-A-disaccharide synthase [Marinilongibacter aquaticus]|uniref:lipid-A-disaccharide synthase n=1 Tax=Marinilongibacter aquaticus TaxID=2975157 RepID=UPI0021BDA3B9|nr:lipid-A-disaccharide synthase [Marinilongibacter aquaticus]UBM58431.1 lipid-A-disaccharide synthase [Marinilongibacter aquaticus]
MKCFIIAGEKSGDLHAGNLAKALKRKQENAVFQGWGGSEMRNAGVEVLQDYSDLAFMGLDFLGSIWKIRKLLQTCKEQIETFSPDVLVLVDYSGFNLRIAKWAKKQGLRVVYYIAPKTWAWNATRNRKIRKNVDLLLAILPFEESYFREKGICTKYVGNPLIERIDDFKVDSEFKNSLPQEFENVIALLPGSRVNEIMRMAGEMKQLARKFEDSLFVIAGIPDVDQHLYETFRCIKNCEVVIDHTYDILSVAKAAVVTSGTATLETALFGVPQIVVYKTSEMAYKIVSKLIKVKYISLVNLILNKPAVKELIQDEYTSANVVTNLRILMDETSNERKAQLAASVKLREIIGTQKASDEASDEILKLIN